MKHFKVGGRGNQFGLFWFHKVTKKIKQVTTNEWIPVSQTEYFAPQYITTEINQIT